MIKGGAQQKDISLPVEKTTVAFYLFGCHVSGGSLDDLLFAAETQKYFSTAPVEKHPALFRIADKSCQPPIHHQNRSMLSDNHIVRFDILMNNALGMGKRNGVTNLAENIQEVKYIIFFDILRRSFLIWAKI